MKLPHTQGVRAFFSFDLAGSAAFKSSAQASFPNGPTSDGKVLGPEWLGLFVDIFRDIPVRVSRQLSVEFERLEHKISPFRVELWRITGDEVLFVTSRLQEEAQLGLLAKVIYAVLVDMDMELSRNPLAGTSKDLGLKAIFWAAGFPLRNTELDIRPQSYPFIRPARDPDVDQNESSAMPGGRRRGEPQDDPGYRSREFLGPEIDLGFRLGAQACPRRLLLSIDVAELIAVNVSRLDRPLRPNFHHVGWSVLKGLYGGRPYPLIWIDYGPTPNQRRTSYEGTQSPFLERYFAGSSLIQPQALVELAEAYLEDTRDTRIKMYIEPAPPPEHIREYDAALKGDRDE